MTERKYLGIKKITVNTSDEENILDVEIALVTDDMNEDLVEIQFTPNTIEGVGDKQWAKCWLIKVVHDGWTDVWDSYIDDDAAGTVIPAFIVTFNTVKTAAETTTEIWTFQVSKCYVLNRDELKVEIEQKRTPGAVYVVCIGTVAVTQV